MLGLAAGFGFQQHAADHSEGIGGSDGNPVKLWLWTTSSEFAVETIIHELGHRFDWWMGGSAQHWSGLSAIWWHATRDSGSGSPTVYGRTSGPLEDFADTFTWAVETHDPNLAAGSGGYSARESRIQRPSQGRLDALSWALNILYFSSR